MGNSPSPAEKRSWENSLVEISELLIQCELGEVVLLVEYQLPYSSKRVDVLALGSDPKTGQPTIIAIELKQWTNASLIEGALDTLKIDSYGNTPILHPAVQVSRYCEYLNDFNRYVSDDNTNLFGIAYLHNWIDANNPALDLIQPTSHGMLFTANQKNRLKEF